MQYHISHLSHLICFKYTISHFTYVTYHMLENLQHHILHMLHVTSCTSNIQYNATSHSSNLQRHVTWCDVILDCDQNVRYDMTSRYQIWEDDKHAKQSNCPAFAIISKCKEKWMKESTNKSYSKVVGKCLPLNLWRKVNLILRMAYWKKQLPCDFSRNQKWFAPIALGNAKSD